MWYFTWMLGVGFAVLLAILNVLWGENEDGRRTANESDKGTGPVTHPGPVGEPEQRTADRS